MGHKVDGIMIADPRTNTTNLKTNAKFRAISIVDLALHIH